VRSLTCDAEEMPEEAVRANQSLVGPSAPQPPAFPLFLRMTGRRCLVVGGGRVGAGKAASLVAAGATVEMISIEFHPDALAVEGITRLTRPVVPTDLDGAWLVVAATGDPTINAEIAVWAEARSIWLNAVDDPDRCTALLGAIHREGPVTIVVSTDGRSPAGASWARDRIAISLGEIPCVVANAATVRDAVRDLGRSSEGLPWRTLLNDMGAAIAADGNADLGQIAEQWLRTHVDPKVADEA
jgi:precorrin-2 dehydrogenase / sirohydrochlorin ferrochelatase